MSDSESKIKNSKRRYNDETAVKKQLKIAKELLSPDVSTKDVKQPHRMSKRHAMDCGKPNCVICGNPRKIFKELTAQEKRMFQDLDKDSDKRGNGIKPREDE